MQYRVLGRTGLKVSEVGFGGAPIGIANYTEVWDPTSEENAQTVINSMHHAIDIGYNYFDTAAGYGNGRSEEIIGRALKNRRSEVNLATKTEWMNKSKEWVIARAESCLQRLQTDYIDVLQFHRGGEYSIEEFNWIMENGPMEAYQQLKKDGKIRFIGITGEDPITLVPFMKTGLIDVIQIRYNIIYQGAWHYVLPLAKELNIGVVVMRPLTSGIFQKLMVAAQPDIQQYVNLNEISLNYVLSDPHISTAIVGMRRIVEVDQNNAISDAIDKRIDLEWLHERKVTVNN